MIPNPDHDDSLGNAEGMKPFTRWTPKERFKLQRLKDKFRAGDYLEDSYSDINPRRLEFVLWLRERGYFYDWPEIEDDYKIA